MPQRELEKDEKDGMAPREAHVDDPRERARQDVSAPRGHEHSPQLQGSLRSQTDSLENPKILPIPKTYGDQESEKHLLASTVELTSQEVTGQGKEQACICGAIQKLQT